jgi:predicted glycosyltransferase
MFSGGRRIDDYSPPPGVDFVQLPATRWDRTVHALPLPVDPRYTLAEIEQKSSQLLVENYLRKKPRIVIVEFYPFSPKRTGKTLNELFDAINKEQKRPIIICSIRTYPRLWDADIDPAWIGVRQKTSFAQ